MTAYASPNTGNYYVGKGRVYFKADGESVFRHMGNCAAMALTTEIEELDHFSSMEGVRSKDKSIVLEKSATLSITLEEWTAENLKLSLLGTITEQSGGDKEIEIFDVNTIAGELKFEGSNEVGPKHFVHLFNVSFKPGGELQLIGDDWGQIELEGDVLTNSESRFGIWTVV